MKDQAERNLCILCGRAYPVGYYSRICNGCKKRKTFDNYLVRRSIKIMRGTNWSWRARQVAGVLLKENFKINKNFNKYQLSRKLAQVLSKNPDKFLYIRRIATGSRAGWWKLQPELEKRL